jgi:hypothetical protein
MSYEIRRAWLLLVLFLLLMFIAAVPIIRLFARGEGDSGGHVL